MSAADSSAIVISVSGEEREVTAKTAAELFADDPKIVVARVNGVLVDLSHELSAGDSVEPVFIHEPDGLNVLRHSAAHVMAQAVQEYRKDAKLGIGPYITDGFYFDFDVAEPFTPEDLKKIEKSMIKIIKSGQLFRRRVVTHDEAVAEMANEPYKLELLSLTQGPVLVRMLPRAHPWRSARVKSPFTTTCTRRTGETVWKDLCRGPHLPNTKLIANGYALMACRWRVLARF